jgi:hypothetical protein
MDKLNKILLTVVCCFALHYCFAQKAIRETWSGGHGCVNLTLNLYTDATYVFISESAMMFVIRSKTKGHYLLTDKLITLYEKKKLSFFLFFSKKLQYRREQYRIVNDHILMYTPEDELSADSSYIKAYNTLYKEH